MCCWDQVRDEGNASCRTLLARTEVVAHHDEGRIRGALLTHGISGPGDDDVTARGGGSRRRYFVGPGFVLADDLSCVAAAVRGLGRRVTVPLDGNVVVVALARLDRLVAAVGDDDVVVATLAHLDRLVVVAGFGDGVVVAMVRHYRRVAAADLGDGVVVAHVIHVFVLDNGGRRETVFQGFHLWPEASDSRTTLSPRVRRDQSIRNMSCLQV